MNNILFLLLGLLFMVIMPSRPNSAATSVGNKFTFQPTNTRDIFIILAGDIQVNGSKRTLNVAIVKNGITTKRYGENTLKTATANKTYQFSTTIYSPGVLKNDHFEYGSMMQIVIHSDFSGC